MKIHSNRLLIEAFERPNELTVFRVFQFVSIDDFYVSCIENERFPFSPLDIKMLHKCQNVIKTWNLKVYKLDKLRIKKRLPKPVSISALTVCRK